MKLSNIVHGAIAGKTTVAQLTFTPNRIYQIIHDGKVNICEGSAFS